MSVIGTSWYNELIHLPNLKSHPHAQLVAICGRNLIRTQEMASKYDIPAVHTGDDDFADSGLKSESLIRTGRLAVVDGSILLGAIGHLSPGRFKRIRRRIADWVLGELQV